MNDDHIFKFVDINKDNFYDLKNNKNIRKVYEIKNGSVFEFYSEKNNKLESSLFEVEISKTQLNPSLENIIIYEVIKEKIDGVFKYSRTGKIFTGTEFNKFIQGENKND